MSELRMYNWWRDGKHTKLLERINLSHFNTTFTDGELNRDKDFDLKSIILKTMSTCQGDGKSYQQNQAKYNIADWFDFPRTEYHCLVGIIIVVHIRLSMCIHIWVFLFARHTHTYIHIYLSRIYCHHNAGGSDCRAQSVVGRMVELQAILNTYI